MTIGLHWTSIPGWEGRGTLVRYTFGISQALRDISPNSIPDDAWPVRESMYNGERCDPGSDWGPGPSVHREWA